LPMREFGIGRDGFYILRTGNFDIFY